MKAIEKIKRRSTLKRLFRIWSVTGERPFRKQKEVEEMTQKKGNDFFRGSFDSIPFLNADAKRTFSHLLLRPGYMIKDYLSGKNEIYLAPMTALIIFYAFFSLVLSIVSPTLPNEDEKKGERFGDTFEVDFGEAADSLKAVSSLEGALYLFRDVVVFMNLDKYPDAIDSKPKAALAAFEENLRSQGVPQFLGKFILMTIAVWLIFRRRYSFSLAASATTSAYVLCQYCFFMLFALIVSVGRSSSLGALLTGTLMAWDYHQLFGIKWKKSIRLAILTGLWMLILICTFYVLLFISFYAISYLR